MKPFHNLASATIPGGGQLSLHEHDGDFFLKLDGRQLMSSCATTSELELAKVGCGALSGIPNAKPRILIGGLGFGFTLRGVLERVGPSASVHVAELLPEVVAWNREFLRSINGMLLEDGRVSLFVDNVLHVMRRAEADRYDVILLDVDNGPVAMVQGGNARLYDRRGFDLIARALKPGGRVAFWSANQDKPFVQRLTEAGFKVQTFESKMHERAKRAAHFIYVAQPGVPQGSRRS